MGWGCSTVASNVLEVLLKPFRDEKTGNCFANNGERYFYEFGREQEDGAIVGSIFKYCEDGKHVTRYGGFRISGRGEVERFPGIPAKRIRDVNALPKDPFSGWVEGMA